MPSVLNGIKKYIHKFVWDLTQYDSETDSYDTYCQGNFTIIDENPSNLTSAQLAKYLAAGVLGFPGAGAEVWNDVNFSSAQWITGIFGYYTTDNNKVKVRNHISSYNVGITIDALVNSHQTTEAM